MTRDREDEDLDWLADLDDESDSDDDLEGLEELDELGELVGDEEPPTPQPPAKHPSEIPYNPAVPLAGQRLNERDLRLVWQPDWLPVTEFAWLEERRAEHAKLIAQRDRELTALNALATRFAEEDQATQRALDEAFRRGDPDNPEPVEITSADDRRDAIKRGEARVSAASRAMIDFAYETVDALRGPVPEGWVGNEWANAGKVPDDGQAAEMLRAVHAEQAKQRRRYEAAEREMVEAVQAEAATRPLAHWLIRTGNAGLDRTVGLEGGGNLEGAPAFTEGSKPLHLPVPGWQPDHNGEDQPVERPGTEDPVEDPWVDESEPYVHALEAADKANNGGRLL